MKPYIVTVSVKIFAENPDQAKEDAIRILGLDDDGLTYSVEGVADQDLMSTGDSII